MKIGIDLPSYELGVETGKELMRKEFEKRIDELKQEYTDNAFSDFSKGWNEGYHISLQKIKDMLK